MDVKLVSDGRVFEPDGSDDYEPGDVAWFEEDVLLVTEIKDGVAHAVEHPAADEIMKAVIADLKIDPRADIETRVMEIHARAMARGYLAAQAKEVAEKERMASRDAMFAKMSALNGHGPNRSVNGGPILPGADADKRDRFALIVSLWEAINRYAVTCGGDPSVHVYGNMSRQKAVVDVEDCVAEIVKAAS